MGKRRKGRNVNRDWAEKRKRNKKWNNCMKFVMLKEKSNMRRKCENWWTKEKGKEGKEREWRQGGKKEEENRKGIVA